MTRRDVFGFLGLMVLAAGMWPAARAAQELRVLVHSSFSLPKALLAQFERDAGVRLSIIKAGDAGEMLNKLILTRAQPIADVVYGLDDALVLKARAANVLDAQSQAPVIDYGFVMLNYDKAWFASRALKLPTTLQELTQPAWRNLVVVQNPATSSPGYAFMLATLAGMGQEPAFAWWASMRANGLKVVKGWSEAYYTEFSRNGGTRPLVVSYASSPAAEVFYSKTPLSAPPTGVLALHAGVWRQSERVALVQGGAQRTAAQRFMTFLLSPAVQEALQTDMWMYPAMPATVRVAALRHAPEPGAWEQLPAAQLAENGADWVSRWVRVVLK